jgi:lysozyme
LTDRVYIDFAGKPTIGYGHLVGPGEHFNEPMTHAEALELLAKDLAATERAIASMVRVELNQHEFDALVSLVFNIGRGHFATSTVLRKLNAGDRGARVETLQSDGTVLVTHTGAAGAFEMWNKARIDGKLQVSAVLDRRRRRERDVFLKPEW